MTQPIFGTFLDWLEHRGVQIVCCGDKSQPPPTAGEMQHDWLKQRADYYEEVEIDHRAKDPDLKALKKCIRLQLDKVQCQEMRKMLTGCRGWDRFVEAWNPGDLILASRESSRPSTGGSIPAPQGPLSRHHGAPPVPPHR